MLKVVVIGATGFIGRALVLALIAQGAEVVVLARNPRSASAMLGPAVRTCAFVLESDASRLAWEDEVRSAAAVVNLSGAGIMDRAWSASRMRELSASRVDVTRAVAEAMATGSARDGAVLVSASAVGIYGMHRDDALLGEESPCGTDFLADLCVRWEGATAPASDAGVRVVSPRLGIVLGPGGGALEAMVRPFRLHAGGRLGSGKQWMSWIHARDVVQALGLMIHATGMRGAFNVVAPNPVTMEQQARAIADVLGTHARAHVPAFALRAILGSGRADVILTGQRATANRLVEAGYRFAFPEISPALRDVLATRQPTSVSVG